MKTRPARFDPSAGRPSAVALAVLAALAGLAAASAARADDAPLPPQSSVEVGLGHASGDDADRSLYGQYNGLRRHATTGLLGFDLNRRDDDTATTLRVEGGDLLGTSRSLDLRWKRQGDWKLGAGYSESRRTDPVQPSNGAELELKRTRLGLSFMKTLGPDAQIDVSLSSENKDGARLYGIGMNCVSLAAPGCGPTTGAQVGWAVLLTPEPVNANHSQIDVRLSYAVGELRINGGYYGSFYRNSNGTLNPNVPATLNNALGAPLPLSAGLQAYLSQSVALPPDNQAHQIDLAGSYAFTPTTHLNAKIAYGQALQHQDFVSAGFDASVLPPGVTDLGGRVDTTLVQIGLTARPLPKLSFALKLRYDDTDDQTPIVPYNVADPFASTLAYYTNRNLSSTKIRSQWQASYQFAGDWRATLGADTEKIDRGVFTATSAVSGITALRQKTDETTVRADLRRRMSEDVSGSIGVAHSRRRGSNWLRDNSGLGVTEVIDANAASTDFARGIFMPTLADRVRDTVKIAADFQPTEELALQLSGQGGRDRYDAPSDYGLSRRGMSQVGLDGSYAFNERWQLTASASYSREMLRQARPDAAQMEFHNLASGLSLGVVGKPKGGIEVGASVAQVDDLSRYAQTLDATADGASAALLAATGGLPDIVYRQTLVKLYGRYELDKRSAVRIDLVHQNTTWRDWTWSYNGVAFRYSDGTTVGQPAQQAVNFIGLRYSYRWQ